MGGFGTPFYFYLPTESGVPQPGVYADYFENDMLPFFSGHLKMTASNSDF